MTYKESLCAAMQLIAKDPLVRFVGYGLKIGRAAGTLKGIPDDRIIETPTAENLMVGLAIGLSLKGLKPVVYIERADFLLNALDAIVNHLDKIALLSHDEYTPTMILRVVVGNTKKPLFTGATHTQNFCEAMRKMVHFPVRELTHESHIVPAYESALSGLTRSSLCYGNQEYVTMPTSTMLFEMKDEI